MTFNKIGGDMGGIIKNRSGTNCWVCYMTCKDRYVANILHDICWRTAPVESLSFSTGVFKK